MTFIATHYLLIAYIVVGIVSVALWWACASMGLTDGRRPATTSPKHSTTVVVAAGLVGVMGQVAMGTLAGRDLATHWVLWAGIGLIPPVLLYAAGRAAGRLLRRSR